MKSCSTLDRRADGSRESLTIWLLHPAVSLWCICRHINTAKQLPGRFQIKIDVKTVVNIQSDKVDCSFSIRRIPAHKAKREFEMPVFDQLEKTFVENQALNSSDHTVQSAVHRMEYHVVLRPSYLCFAL